MLPHEIVVLDRLPSINGTSRGLLITPAVIDDLWAALLRAVNDDDSAELALHLPAVRTTGLNQVGALGEMQIVSAGRARDRSRRDLRRASWRCSPLGHWNLTIERSRGDWSVFWVWHLMTASLAVGPADAMRRHLCALSEHPEFDMIVFPPERPAAFRDVLSAPEQWPLLLGPEELAILLRSGRRQVREIAIRSLGEGGRTLSRGLRR